MTKTSDLLFPEHFGAIDEGDYVVLSLQPRAYDQIAAGTKKMEYRRRFRRQPTIAFVYVSAPISSICAIVHFGQPIEGSAQCIAEIAREHTNNYDDVHAYLADKDHGFAVPILAFRSFDPLPLADLREQFDFVAPQSYMYAPRHPSLFQHLLQRAEVTDLSCPLGGPRT